jgi:hypothetical protein
MQEGRRYETVLWFYGFSVLGGISGAQKYTAFDTVHDPDEICIL